MPAPTIPNLAFETTPHSHLVFFTVHECALAGARAQLAVVPVDPVGGQPPILFDGRFGRDLQLPARQVALRRCTIVIFVFALIPVGILAPLTTMKLSACILWRSAPTEEISLTRSKA